MFVGLLGFGAKNGFVGAKVGVGKFRGGVGDLFVVGLVAGVVGGVVARFRSVSLAGGSDLVIEIPLSLELAANVFGGGNDFVNGFSSEESELLEEGSFFVVGKFGRGGVTLGEARTSPKTMEPVCLGEEAIGTGFAPCWNVVTRCLPGSNGNAFEVVLVGVIGASPVQF